jgi:lactate dehydrogenase-like 2-hydroxyacid dehydrogenase
MDTRVGPTTRIEHRRDHPDRRFEGDRSCQCSEDVEQLFKAADIVSIHIPLDEDTNSLVRSQSVRDVKELNLIPPLAFVKKEPRMLDDYRIFRWWQGK